MGCGASAAKPASKGSKSNMPCKEVKPGGFSGATFFVDNKGNIKDFYDIEKKKTGEGSYGSVYKAVKKNTNIVRAVKTIPKSAMKNLERFQSEIAIQKMLDHPNICKLYESFEDYKNVYLVMELCAGGELFDRIIEYGHVKEVQAAILMQNMFRPIYYMHEMHITHRDLKPENFLFTTKESIEKSTLKVIDFGLARKFELGQVLTTKAGTPYYVAPQVLTGRYDQSADLWSLGVIMYVVLCGYPPFCGESDADVLAKVRLGNFSFNSSDWKGISEDAKALIKCLLKMNPRDRYTAEQALNHVWIKNKAPKATDAMLQSSNLDNLRHFRSQNKLKKAALRIIASELTDPQIKELRNIFMSLDENGDGFLTSVELKEGLLKSGITKMPDDFQSIIDGIDSDGSGVIDYSEFIAASIDKKLYTEEEICWQAFKVFDLDGNGKITKEEMLQILMKDQGDLQAVAKAAMNEIIEMMKEIDSDGDGDVDFQEFMAMMRGQPLKAS